MWKFTDFSATQILREINFGHFEARKSDFLTIKAALNFKSLGIFDNLEASNFDFFGKFHTWKCQIFPEIQNSELLIWSKSHFFELQNDQN